MKTRVFKSAVSIALTLCLLLTAVCANLTFSAAENTAISLENMGDYAHVDFANHRLFTLVGPKLYLYDTNYGSGYELFDYSTTASNPESCVLLDAKSSGDLFYSLFSDGEACYLHWIDTSQFQIFTNKLNFNCEKFIALDNGDCIVSLNQDGDYVFVKKADGSHSFYPVTEHIEDFYGAQGNTVYYRTASGLTYATYDDSSFTQSQTVLSGVDTGNLNCIAPFEVLGTNISASNSGAVYQISNTNSFSQKINFDRTSYSQSSGSLTAILSGAGLIVGADGQNTLTAYNLSSFEPVSSVSTVYQPFLIIASGNGIICIEKDNSGFYYETFDSSDFIAIEPELINLNEEAVYSDRTTDDIAKLYSGAIGDINLTQNALSDEGSLSSPYRGTLIDSEVQSTLVDYSTYLRWLAGLTGYSYGGDDTAAVVGKGAVLLNAAWRQSGYTGHTPSKPSDMDDDFYNEAYTTCGGNINYGYYGTVKDQILAIRALNDDIYNASNNEIDTSGYHQGYNTPGHRNCFLQRGGNKITYGYADAVMLQYYEYAQRNPNESGTISETGNNEAAYAWPAPGYFPSDEIDTRAVWTVYFNTDKLDLGKRTPVITITDLDTGETFTRNSEMHNADGQREGYSTSNFWGKCLTFSPPAASSYAGKSYMVTVNNLVNDNSLPAALTYTINFFDYEGEYTIDGLRYSMDSYGKLTALDTPIVTTEEPTTEEPTSEEPTTEEPTTEEPTTEEPTTEEITTEEPTTEEPTTEEATTEEPTTEEPTTLEPTTEFIEKLLHIHSISDIFPNADYTISLNQENKQFEISYFWNKDISLDSYQWTFNYDTEKLKCISYLVYNDAVNSSTPGKITVSWSDSNNPLRFSEGEVFASFVFEAVTDGETTVFFTTDNLTEHIDVPETTEEPTTEEPTTAEHSTEEIKTEEPSTAEPTTEEPATLEPTTAEPTEEPTTLEPTTAEPTTVEITTAEPTTVQETTEPVATYIIGDVNGDGIVDVLDALVIQKYAVDKATLSDAQKFVADVNNDGSIDILDSTDIQKFSVEKIKEFKKK